MIGVFQLGFHHGHDHRGHVHCFFGEGQGIRRQRVFLHLGDVAVDAAGQGQNQGDAHDADAAGKAGQQRTGLFGTQVVQAQAQGSEETHRSAAHAFMHRCFRCGFRRKGIAVADDAAVPQANGAVGVFFGQLGVVGNHDHQAVLCHFLQQLHYLLAGLGVQRAGGLIGQQDVGVVYQCAGNGHALHLAAGHLAGLFVALVAQTHRLQRFAGALPALLAGNARDGHGQFHVGQHALVGNQVIALKNKADGVVAVGIPVPILVLSGRNTPDDQVAAVIAVQAADDVQQGGLAAAAGAQNGHELVVAEGKAHAVQRRLGQVAGGILLANFLNLKHKRILSAGMPEFG